MPDTTDFTRIIDRINEQEVDVRDLYERIEELESRIEQLEQKIYYPNRQIALIKWKPE